MRKCRGVLSGAEGWAKSKRFLIFQAMSEEQLKAAQTEATAQAEDGVEEILEVELEGVAGGDWYLPTSKPVSTSELS